MKLHRYDYKNGAATFTDTDGNSYSLATLSELYPDECNEIITEIMFARDQMCELAKRYQGEIELLRDENEALRKQVVIGDKPLNATADAWARIVDNKILRLADDREMVVAQEPTTTIERLEFTDDDRAAIKKWLGGVGFKAGLAASLVKQGWISEKQRHHLHTSERSNVSYRTGGTRKSRDSYDNNDGPAYGPGGFYGEPDGCGNGYWAED